MTTLTNKKQKQIMQTVTTLEKMVNKQINKQIV